MHDYKYFEKQYSKYFKEYEKLDQSKYDMGIDIVLNDGTVLSGNYYSVLILGGEIKYKFKTIPLNMIEKIIYLPFEKPEDLSEDIMY